VNHQSGAQHVESLAAGVLRGGCPGGNRRLYPRTCCGLCRADLVVCRAGATTVAEIAVAGVASILVRLSSRGGRPPDGQRAFFSPTLEQQSLLRKASSAHLEDAFHGQRYAPRSSPASLGRLGDASCSRVCRTSRNARTIRQVKRDLCFSDRELRQIWRPHRGLPSGCKRERFGPRESTHDRMHCWQCGLSSLCGASDCLLQRRQKTRVDRLVVVHRVRKEPGCSRHLRPRSRRRGRSGAAHDEVRLA